MFCFETKQVSWLYRGPNKGLFIYERNKQCQIDVNVQEIIFKDDFVQGGKKWQRLLRKKGGFR